MKKKLLFVSLIVILFVCTFAISSNAALIPLDSDPGLDCDESLVSTFDYDEFNNSTREDKTSRAVLTDGTKYYVFPAYYFVGGGQYSYNFDNLNNAIKAETGSSTNMFSDMKAHLVRIQLPSYVTSISSPKFENHTLLKECIFSENFRQITSQDAFGGCTALEHISSIENFTAIGIATFTGCTNLEVDIVWPSAITSVPARVFQNCKKIKSITFSEGLTYVGEKAFQNCNAITELIMPNSFKEAGKHAFGSMVNLKTLNFGAGFTTFSSSNFDYETTQGSSNLKYVYLPAGIYENVSTLEVSYGRHIFGAGTNVSFFFTGDAEEAQNLKDHFAKIGNNAVFANATLVEYDPEQDYTGYADALGYSIIVYDYNLCEAFYNSVHTDTDKDCSTDDKCDRCKEVTCVAHTSKIAISYTNFGEKGKKSITCDYDNCNGKSTVDADPIFTAEGYSVREDGKALLGGYKIDTEALKAYNAANNTKLTYGIVMSNAANVEFDGNNAYVGGKGVMVSENSESYSTVKYTISGFSNTEALVDLDLVITLYVVDGNNDMSFVQSDTSLKGANADINGVNVALNVVSLRYIANKTLEEDDTINNEENATYKAVLEAIKNTPITTVPTSTDEQ